MSGKTRAFVHKYCQCPADFGGIGVAQINDIFIYLNAWFAGNPRCNVNGDSIVTIDDIFVFINIWFARC
jgi:hypothetical protein